MLHRFCVFSHDELVCTMATDPDKLDISVAASTYQDMLRMVEAEKELRKSLLDWVGKIYIFISNIKNIIYIFKDLVNFY